MKTFEDFHPFLASTINGIANEYGRKASWHGATHEDFSQEMVAWLLDHESSVAARFREDIESATAYVAKCLRNECKDHVASLRGQTATGNRDSQYDYGREELKVLLQLMFTPAEAEHMSVYITESIADVEKVYPALCAGDRAIIEAFHRDEYTNRMLAEMYGISEANMSYRHNRAVLRLQRLLGTSETSAHNPWTGRRAVSNSTARAMTSNTYESGESA